MRSAQNRSEGTGMSNVVYFKSSATLSTEKNLHNFILFSRDKVTIWSDLGGFEWEAPVWPTHLNSTRFLGLYERGLHHSKAPKEHQLMSSPFIWFAKAFLRYTQNILPTKTFKRTVAALQLLEASLIEIDGNADVTKVSGRHLDRSIQLMILEKFKDRQGIGNSLQRIAKNLAEWHIATSNIKYWQHPFLGKNSNASVYKAAPNSISNKLPTDDTLLAIAEIFANGYANIQDDEDIFTTCVTCLLLCAPMRINEILHFREKPLREELDVNGKKQLYISYWVPKNGRYVRKEIPAVMADLAREAVKRLTLITEESRRLAIHIENNPEKFYRHSQCPNVSDNQVLTVEELTHALGFNNSKSVETFIYRCTGRFNTKGWTLNSIWQLIMAEHKKLNPYFPYQVSPTDSSNNKPLKMSESLICFRYQQLSNKNQASAVLLAPSNRDFYAKRLQSRDVQRGKKTVNMSILLKHGYKGLELRSHQLRHFLNTLAQEAGVSIDVITRWSTRASQTQSRVYMHQDTERKSSNIAAQLGMRPIQKTALPITQNEYRLMDLGPIITTRYGICTHDYTETPCNKHADCLNCSELLLCKGHRRSLEEIIVERNRIQENLAAAQAEIDAGHRVASRWQQVHSQTIDRLNRLIEIMTDNNVADGSPVRIQGTDFSHQMRVLNNTATKSLDISIDVMDFGHSDDIAACLRLLSEEN